MSEVPYIGTEFPPERGESEGKLGQHVELDWKALISEGDFRKACLNTRFIVNHQTHPAKA